LNAMSPHWDCEWVAPTHVLAGRSAEPPKGVKGTGR